MTNKEPYSIANANQAQSTITKEIVIREAYGAVKNNWGDLSAFQGDYINLGFWRDISWKDKTISRQERILSSKHLYDYVIEISNLRDHVIDGDYTVLEIGCGRGVGLANLFLQHDVKNLKNIVGVDLTLDQLKRAVNIHWRSFRRPYPFQLVHASADNTTCVSNSIDRVFSVEVAQHFNTFKPFAKEMKRILKPEGQVVFVSHLATNKGHFKELREKKLLTESKGIDVLLPFDEAISAFRDAGFKVECFSIGEYVFPGFKHWITQTESAPSGKSHKTFEAYASGHIDYYVFIADLC